MLMLLVQAETGRFARAEALVASAVSWLRLGVERLAAIAVIRTGLNYFLSQEMENEAGRLEAAGAPAEATQRAAPRSGRAGRGR